MITIKALYNGSYEFSIPRFLNKKDLSSYLVPYFTLADEDGYGNQLCVLNVDVDKIHLPVRLIRYCTRVLDKLNIELDRSEILEFFGPIEFDVSNQDYLYEEQYEFVKIITSRFSGLIQLPTGYGKNTIITYLIKYWKGKGNILILSPTSSIRDEIIMRCETYIPGEVDTDFNTRICCTMAAGLNKRNIFKDGELDEWLSEVGMIIIDECEAIPPTTAILLEEKCTSNKYIYGFSATADKYHGRNLSNFNSLEEIFYTQYELLYYVGESLVYKKATKKIDIILTRGKFMPETETGFFATDYINSILNVLESENFKKFVEYVCYQAEGTVYLPIKIKDHAYNFASLIPKNYHTVVWNADVLWSTNDMQIDDYDQLKTVVDTGLVKLLIANQISFYGVDFKGLSDLILILGTQFNTVTQIIGRVIRYPGTPKVWLISSTGYSKIYNRCHWIRYKMARDAYPHNLIQLEPNEWLNY